MALRTAAAVTVARAPTPNVTRSLAAANPQLSPTRAALVPGDAPLYASPLVPVREGGPVAPGLLSPRIQILPEETSMSLLGRIGGAVKGAVGGFVTGGPAGALGGAALGAISSGGARRPTVGSQVLIGAGTSAVGRMGGALAPTTCPPGSRHVPLLGCVDIFPGGQGTGSGPIVRPGEARTSRAMIGASAYAPMTRNLTVRSCGKGSVLGIDGLCYDKRTIRKDQRMWVPGRKPLLTGGDLNAIAKASRAAARMKVQQKRLEHLGLLKRPKPSRGGSRGVITKAEAARALRS